MVAVSPLVEDEPLAKIDVVTVNNETVHTCNMCICTHNNNYDALVVWVRYSQAQKYFYCNTKHLLQSYLVKLFTN